MVAEPVEDRFALGRCDGVPRLLSYKQTSVLRGTSVAVGAFNYGPRFFHSVERNNRIAVAVNGQQWAWCEGCQQVLTVVVVRNPGQPAPPSLSHDFRRDLRFAQRGFHAIE